MGILPDLRMYIKQKPEIIKAYTDYITWAFFVPPGSYISRENTEKLNSNNTHQGHVLFYKLKGKISMARVLP